jgi:monofunctional biosynthetic peptidoglycan transglycosylase
MAKRVTFNKDFKSKTGSSKFDSLSDNPRKKNQKWNFSYFLRKLGLYLFYIWLSTLFAIVMLKFVPVYMTPTMASRKIDAMLTGKPSQIYSQWTPYSQISKNYPLAILASEDQLFPVHHGFDFKSMWGAVQSNMKGRKIKGASTISQQVAKNVFLWQDRSYIRKGLEVYFTLMIELVWGKKRILEVYLNVAETGKMTFGVESASRRFYHHSAEKASTTEAARLAACLPNPIRFTIENPSNYINRRTSSIKRQMSGLGGKKFLYKID